MLNIALLGAGRIGRIHAANVQAHPDLSLSHVVDPSAENAQALSAMTGAKISTLEETLSDTNVKGVIIASSTDTHLDYCLKAHAAQKTIFCEKPVDLDLARAEAAAETLKTAKIFLGFNRRFDPTFQAVKAKLKSGAIGALETLQITSNDPGPPPIAYIKVSGGLFKDMAIHDFDMSRWLLEEEPVEVFAWGSCLVDPAIGEAGDIDTARILLKTASGKLCVISNSRRSGFGYDQRLEAFASGGMASAANMTESTMHVWTDSRAQSDRFQNFFLERYAVAYRAEMSHFAEILKGHTIPSATYADGVAALRLAEAAARSLRSGQPVRL